MRATGSLQVRVERDAYFVCECSGAITRSMSRAAQDEIDRLVEEHPHIDCIMYDGTDVETFEPGFAIEWIRWAQGRARRSRRVAIVTRLASGAAVASVAKYLVPKTPFVVFTDRSVAASFLETRNDTQDRFE